MFELRKQQVEKYSTLTFAEFHAIVCKSMPDANEQPQMYNLCYDLMKLSWETAQRQKKS